MSEANDERIAAVRRFNRFFTRQIGALREGLLHTPYPLPEARLIYELGHRDSLTAAELGRDLALDAGYMSRLLARLEEVGQIEKVRAENDGRQRLLQLTAAGRETFALLDRRSREEIAELLGGVSDYDQRQLLKAMQTIETIFSGGLKFSAPFYLRAHEPGDMGYITHLHGQLYAREYGYDQRFEALVAQITADFIHNFKPDRERCWIAEMNGEIVGSVFCVQAAATVAKLRLLIVAPQARGLGLGSRLVQECVKFAARVGYEKMTLWTQSDLLEARHIYAKCGFKRVKSESAPNFGLDLTSETWELPLKPDTEPASGGVISF